jgi:hypothetical protein
MGERTTRAAAYPVVAAKLGVVWQTWRRGSIAVDSHLHAKWACATDARTAPAAHLS